MRVQYTLDMSPAEAPEEPAPEPERERIIRKYLLSEKAVNMVEQIHLITGRRKSSIVDDAVMIFAILIRCGKDAELKLSDADEIADVLEEYIPGRGDTPPGDQEMSSTNVRPRTSTPTARSVESTDVSQYQ